MTTRDTTVVAYASKMGGTKGIADAIGAELTVGTSVTSRESALCSWHRGPADRPKTHRGLAIPAGVVKPCLAPSRWSCFTT